jgi:KTSC domain
MTPVKSDSIAAVKHDPASRTLTVQFNNGGLYTYADVSADQHASLMRADSIGTHFHKNIRPNFKAKKVTR